MRAPACVKLIAGVLTAPVYAAGSHNCNIVRWCAGGTCEKYLSGPRPPSTPECLVIALITTQSDLPAYAWPLVNLAPFSLSSTPTPSSPLPFLFFLPRSILFPFSPFFFSLFFPLLLPFCFSFCTSLFSPLFFLVVSFFRALPASQPATVKGEKQFVELASWNVFFVSLTVYPCRVLFSPRPKPVARSKSREKKA